MKRGFVSLEIILGVFIGAISLVLLLIVIGPLLGFGLGTGGSAQDGFDSFKDTVLDACKSADLAGDLFDFPLPPQHSITQFYLATSTDNAVYSTTTAYGKNKGYETFDYGLSCVQNGGQCMSCDDGLCSTECAPNTWYPSLTCCAEGQDCLQACCIPRGKTVLNPAASAQSGTIIVDSRNTQGIAQGLALVRDTKLIEACADRTCMCLIKYNGCHDVSGRGGYNQFLQDIKDHVYAEYANPISINTLTFEDQLAYTYLGTARARDIAGCTADLTGPGCKRAILQLLDGATRQFFAWQACENEVSVLDCTPLDALGCSALPDSYQLTDAPLLIHQGDYYMFSVLPASEYSGGLSIDYMRLHKSANGYIVVEERVRG